MEIPVYTLDSFTNLPFKGNPAAICPLLHELSDDLYYKIAAEMNLSETAFITRINPSDSFTTENVNPTLVFETKSGDLSVTQKEEGYIMDFPLNPPTRVDPNDFKDTIKAAVGNLPVQEVLFCYNTKKLLIRLADSCDISALTDLKVDTVALENTERSGRFCAVIITMKGSPDCQPRYDFYSRDFSPWFGVPEDPVTGSNHTILGSYWSEKLGKKKMLAYQCSSRGGELELELRDDGRINIAGQAITILQGTIKL
ncbi:phenazine biosynthesis-like domain-containing protein 2 isoform X2 [Astatotilapia calliptera]|nr:phenazine biosynthesis-like domain-containing protein 2 isoform X2 [Astatotilapia calliptera]XP_042078829.1 phenazine biosynthesis-like domain-containing protein 2 isoform X2 [Haplochromis burtoni]